MLNIAEMTAAEYAQAIFNLLGKGYQHGLIIYKSWVRKGAVPSGHPAFKNCQNLLKDMISHTDFSLPKISGRICEAQTEKILFELEDKQIIESVVIPMRFGWSLCVSSQVGCRMGCTFCQTGRLGLLRQLKVHEIVNQLHTAKNVLGYDIRNIVFMGMGEPFDNFDVVKKAVEIFTDSSGFGLGARHITISTSGRVDGILRMKNEIPIVNLAVSINASNELMRRKLMPITRKYSMEMLKKTMQDYSSNPFREILVEYILIKGVTDTIEAADELADYLKELPVKVNLIPYNPQKPTQFERSDMEKIESFKKRLQYHGLLTLLRTTKGSDLMAACGQLGKRVV
jgi:23S rRNA (adenine2503-C2)-methyltransferase